MTQHTTEQAFIFIALCAAGYACGTLYDLLYPLRKRAGMLRLIFSDLIYFILSSTVCVGVLVYVNAGEVRLFTLCGVMTGALCYFLGVRRLFLAIIAFVRRKTNADVE